MRNQHIKILQLIVVCLLLISCNTKEKTESPNLIINPSKKFDVEKLNVKTTEVFDLKTFHDKQKDKLYEYVANDNNVIRLSENEECYKKELIVGNSFIQTFKYDKTTKSLIRKSSVFLGIPIGIWTSYDENGNGIQQENYDEGFDFTVTDLIAILKKDLQIDLINNQYQSLLVNRYLEKRFNFIDHYFYLIEVDYRTIKVDGTTGAIISDETKYPGECVEY